MAAGLAVAAALCWSGVRAQQTTLPPGVRPISPADGMAVTDPEQLAERTPGHLVQDLHAAFGVHRARAVHSKGTILQGRFEPALGIGNFDVAQQLQCPLPQRPLDEEYRCCGSAPPGFPPRRCSGRPCR